jgi:hypothetical protein
MWTTLLFSARQVRRSTPHFWLAAVSSISRAVASECPESAGWEKPARAGMAAQSASNSSANIMARVVRTPWPISERVTHSRTTLSGVMRM